MSRASTRGTLDLPPPSSRRVPRPSRRDGWNTLADIGVFIFAVEAELEAMDRERVGVHRRGRKPDLSLRRRLIGVCQRSCPVPDQAASLILRPFVSRSGLRQTSPTGDQFRIRRDHRAGLAARASV